MSVAAPHRVHFALAAAVALVGVSACADSPVLPDRAAEPTTAWAKEKDAKFSQFADKAFVGKKIFFDEDLSVNRNQACASCHAPEWGWTSPEPEINLHGGVMEGSVPGRFGARKPQSAAYASQAPIFHWDPEAQFRGAYVGGNFWDGRATGDHLGNASADQAQFPFLSAGEQALRDPACVVHRVSTSNYAPKFAGAFGPAIFDIAFPEDIDALCAVEGDPLDLSPEVRAQVDEQYDNVGLALGLLFEDSHQVNAFTSKFDAWQDGKAQLSEQELQGWELFNGRGRCDLCHASEGEHPLFTDFEFDNIGAPKNPENPVYATDPAFVDLMLGGVLGDPGQDGKIRIPTARNADKRPYPGAPKAYMHNASLKSLEQLVHWYNTRDVLPVCAAFPDPGFGTTCWYAPEVGRNLVPSFLVGNLRLTDEEEAALVAFLKTLTDGYVTN